MRSSSAEKPAAGRPRSTATRPSLEHGEPHDPCPVEGCAGELRFAHR